VLLAEEFEVQHGTTILIQTMSNFLAHDV